MNTANHEDASQEIGNVLGSFRERGIKLWSENGELHYKAPRGVLTRADIERLRTCKGQIVASLNRTAVESAESRMERPGPGARAPLAFSQLARWRSLQDGELPRLRQIASATLLRGRLNVAALHRAIVEIVRRHEALRTRIVVRDGLPWQEIAEVDDVELSVDDLATVPTHLQSLEVKRLIEELILEPVELATGPLFGVRLARLSAVEHVLIVAMEHLVSDASSLAILERDLFTAYAQAVRGRAFSLPKIRLQFADFAVWQRNVQNTWIARHSAYWNERLEGCKRLRFPQTIDSPGVPGLGWESVAIQFGRSLRTELQEACRQRHTTLVMGALTAFVALGMRWCDASQALFQYQSDGRTHPEIENTIGFFTSALYLRVALHPDDRLVDLLSRLTQEYCAAYEHADASYIASQVPAPEFTRSAVFNWVPQGSRSDLSELNGTADAIVCSALPFAHPMLKRLEFDREPGLLLFDTDDDVVGGVYFPLRRFSVATMERFSRNFLMFVELLLRQPEIRIRDVQLL